MTYKSPVWMKRVLLIAGFYNLAWGLFAILAPLAVFRWAGMAPPNYPELWQCIGMIVGVYGIGYMLAARDPVRHWPIVLVGLLGKIFGPIGFAMALWRGTLPTRFGWTIVTNDLIWWLPFGVMLWHAFRESTAPRGGDDRGDGPNRDTRHDLGPWQSIVSDQGKSLREMSAEGPVLVTFLRHAGCVFHREALADLRRVRKQLELEGVQLAIVHMGEGDNPAEQAAARRLDGVAHFSDPNCRLYRAFGLQRGSFWQLLGPRVWWPGCQAFFRGHGVGCLVGDGFQMAGVFLVRDGQVVSAYRHQTSADRPDYLDIARRGAADHGQPPAEVAGHQGSR